MPIWKQQVIDKGFNPSDFQWFPFMEDALSPITGMIGETAHDNYDQGDTLNREGHLMTVAVVLKQLGKMNDNEYAFISQRYEEVLSKLQDPNDPSNFARTIVPGYWGSVHNCMSRDQMTPNLVAVAMSGSKRLWPIFWNHLKRRGLLFTTNTQPNWPDDNYKKKMADLTVLSYWSIYIRGMPKAIRWILYPLVALFDLDLLVNTLIKVLYYGKDPTNTDDIQHVGLQTQAYYSMPTPISALSRWIYKKYRPLARRNEFIPAEQLLYGSETNPTQVVLNTYYRHVGNGPALNEVWRPIVEELFKK